MERPEVGGVDIVVFAAEIREPYMGNNVPIKVHIFRRRGRIVYVEIENPEGMKMTAKKEREYSMSSEVFHRATTGLP